MQQRDVRVILEIRTWLIGCAMKEKTITNHIIIEGSLEAELPTIWRDENAVQLSRSSEMEKVRRKKMQVREKVGKSQNTVFFQCFVAPEGLKVGSLKRRVRRHLGR